MHLEYPGRSTACLRSLRAVLASCFVVCAAFGQSTGVVSGQVSNAATAAFLEGAEIGVEGTNKYVLTDREGRYELSLPSGVATLMVRYTGLEPEKAVVDVRPGARAIHNIQLNSGIYKLDTFTVSGPREGSAQA
ncbi:MAG TPA: carboxypeptidase-like regulatory domain-containing protein, partial [Opitutaceae bacterium]|nr:carboxypeptidase-like regulatory domain-containing protein [Opitutaceae bacterium]